MEALPSFQYWLKSAKAWLLTISYRTRHDLAWIQFIDPVHSPRSRIQDFKTKWICTALILFSLQGHLPTGPRDFSNKPCKAPFCPKWNTCLMRPWKPGQWPHWFGAAHLEAVTYWCAGSFTGHHLSRTGSIYHRSSSSGMQIEMLWQ